MNWRVVGIVAVIVIATISGALVSGLIPYTSKPACGIRQAGSISIPNASGRLDHMSFDPTTGALYLAALGNDSLAVANVTSGRLEYSLRGFEGPQGVLYIRERATVYITNGGSGILDILSSGTNRLLANITLGTDADNVRYDARTNLVYVGYGEGAIAKISAINQSVIGRVLLSGHPESFQLESNTSLMFVNVATSGYVAVVNRTSNSIIARWPLINATGNYPMALDETHGRLLIGTRSPSQLMVLDSRTGRTVTTTGLPLDPDDIFYDGANGCIYVSSGSGYVTTIKQTDSSHYYVVSEVSTSPGARTSLLVPGSGLYFVAAPATANSPAKIMLFRVG